MTEGQEENGLGLRAFRGARDIFRGVVDSRTQDAIEEERDKDVKRAALAFAELSVDYDAAIRLLTEEWLVSKDTAEYLMRQARLVDLPIKRLRKYFAEQDYSRVEFVDYVRKYHVHEKLQADRTLSKVSPEELMSRVEEN